MIWSIKRVEVPRSCASSKARPRATASQTIGPCYGDKSRSNRSPGERCESWEVQILGCMPVTIWPAARTCWAVGVLKTVPDTLTYSPAGILSPLMLSCTPQQLQMPVCNASQLTYAAETPGAPWAGLHPSAAASGIILQRISAQLLRLSAERLELSRLACTVQQQHSAICWQPRSAFHQACKTAETSTHAVSSVEVLKMASQQHGCQKTFIIYASIRPIWACCLQQIFTGVDTAVHCP